MEAAEIRSREYRPGSRVARRPAGELAEVEDRLEAIIHFSEAVLRGPREAGVSIQNSGNAPTPDDLLFPVVAAPEDRRRVNSEDLKGMADVIVGPPKSSCYVPLVKAPGVCVRPGVQTVSESILRVNLK